MAFPLDRFGVKPSESVHQAVLSQFQGDLAERLNVEQMFILIDGLLPFEACLYYQVLPLYLEGSRLNLGMVSPNDTSATDYIRRIVSYHHYSVITRPVSSNAVQSVLSAYLNYSGSKTVTPPSHSESSQNRSYRNAKARAERSTDPSTRPTLFIDSPEELANIGFASATAKTAPLPSTEIPVALQESAPASLEASPISESVAEVAESVAESVAELKVATTLLPLEEAPAGRLSDDPLSDAAVPDKPLPDKPLPDKPLALEIGNQLIPDSSTTPISPDNRAFSLPSAPSPPLLNPLPALELQVNLITPTEELVKLSPKLLFQELLGRALVGGIGRLYFERQSEYGRVLWSQNGVLQSALDRLELPLFQGMIHELKLLTRMPLIPVQTAKQVEIERLYQQTRMLLRCRFIPTERGEEATIQVLRGVALKFYQQQQLATLERDALTIAKQLQTKVNQIRDRALSEGNLSSAKIEVLPALSQLLRHIEEQLDSLQEEEPEQPPQHSVD
jgi:Type II secretion system (T2SS), protein E, N-terminal domain